MKRGSSLLVGVGGSGKQSLTRLASFIAEQDIFQVTLTKTYNLQSFKDDLRVLFTKAGAQMKQVTFLFTDAEVKDEAFLECINSVLLTGEVAGLFAKEEYLALAAEVQPLFEGARPDLVENPANLKAFFTDCVRDNLHVVLAMSPMNPLFAERARKFPGLISCCTIDWFLPWPNEALVAVSAGMIDQESFNLQASEAVKKELIQHMGYVHRTASEACDEYFQSTKRAVFQTPKSYLSFIKNYKTTYSEKLVSITDKESRTILGLEKLIVGAKDVEKMKVMLKGEEKKLEQATLDTNAMLEELRESSMVAQAEGDKVAIIKNKCETDASRIAGEKEECERDLAKAQPIVDRALKAIDSILPKHISEIKKLAQPAAVVKLVFDGCLLLFRRPIARVTESTLKISKQEIKFLEPAWKDSQLMMSDARFLQNLYDFGANEKDLITPETIELMEPYVDLCLPDGTPCMTAQMAKTASKAAEGLCTWVIAMTEYHHAAKIIKPKLEALALAEGNLSLATAKLKEASEKFEAVSAKLKELQDQFEAQMAHKLAIEEGLATTKAKMNKAENLIEGLAGERIRWDEDRHTFADTKARLVGDCALSCAFLSYCGPFNQGFRNKLTNEYFTKDLLQRNVPVTNDLDVVSFSVDQGTLGDWQLQGLPSDPLSSQNGILVTSASRYPLLVDPQKQGLAWILRRERDAGNLPDHGEEIIAMDNKKVKDRLEFCLSEGKSLIIAVEEAVDPLLDPVLEKRIQRKGKSQYIVVSDKKMDYSPSFALFLISRLPNPHFSPELQAKATLIDFTVTQKGLEEQLLGKVIQREQKALEEQLNVVVEQVTQNTKALLKLDADLLARLTNGTGNLLDDDELVGVLKEVKDTASEVKKKLIVAQDTRKAIETKREQYRPVAERGAVLYFSIVDMSHVNVMYQVSLKQFLELFSRGMTEADKSSLLNKRVENIIETMTYITYRYINRGLYEQDRLIFVFILTMKILITANLIQQSEFDIFLQGGAALDINSVQAKPFSWMADSAWLNVVVLTQRIPFFKTLTNDVRSADAVWKKWYEDNTPEALPLPSYDQQINENKDIGPFLRLLLVRALRMDRTMLCIAEFIRNTSQMGPRFVEPTTDTVEMIMSEMDSITPVIFLLSVGADPTEAIELLAKKRKTSVDCISMGEGQSVPAIASIKAAWQAGTWVLLQNCELGLDLMVDMEEMILKSSPNENFRLMFTSSPSTDFPLGLLQLCTKITNEPPQGMRAGLLRSFNSMVDQDRLERIESSAWRRLVHTLCFLHSIVQERKKFGPLGWNIPYEYNTGDLSACLTFLEKHLFDNDISWSTIQYMVAQVQYGGKITDDKDHRLFGAYADRWLSEVVMKPEFTFNPPHLVVRLPNDFNYCVLDSPDVQAYRDYAATFPHVDSPEIIGLHPNADMTFRLKEVNLMLNTLGNTKPQGGGGGGGVSIDTIIYDKAAELLEKLPADFVEEEYILRIKKMGGLSVPLNIFLYQEIQRMQAVIHTVRVTLQDLRLAIKGEVVMTKQLLSSIHVIYAGKVPGHWLETVGGDEFSWYLPTLGLWYASLSERYKQYHSWLEDGRPVGYWLTGFFNPQGFLTGMKQEVTRLHRADKWALDDVIYQTDVTSYEGIERLSSAPKEGVYLYGLSMEGAQWDGDIQGVAESLPKVLFDNLPVLKVSVDNGTKAKNRGKDYYVCPCYKYPARTDRYLIFDIPLPSGGRPSWHWVMRGVGILCSTD
jgi:dynein heavy chain